MAPKFFDKGWRNKFGNVSLDIRDTMTSDSGIISCTVSNLKGQATTTGTLKVTGKDGVVSTTQHPAGLQGLENIQKADFIKGDLKSADEQPSSYEKPVFLKPLPEGVTLKENQPLSHFALLFFYTCGRWWLDAARWSDGQMVRRSDDRQLCISCSLVGHQSGSSPSRPGIHLFYF